MDPASWNPEPGSGSLTIPRWLGGARTCAYIVTHAWTRWLIIWPLIKFHEWRHAPR